MIQRRMQILLLNIGPPIFARLQQNFLTLDKLGFALHNLFSKACDLGLLGSRNISRASGFEKLDGSSSLVSNRKFVLLVIFYL